MKKSTSESAFYERMRQLAQVNKTVVKESTDRTLGTLIDYKKASDGVAYGIIKENHNYYIKKAGTKSNPDVSDFAYIGGLSNITDYQYKTLSEADKQRNMIFNTINEGSKKVSKTGSITKKRLIKEGFGYENGFESEEVEEGDASKEIDKSEEMIPDLEAATDAAEAPVEPEMGGGDMGSMESNTEEMPTPEGDMGMGDMSTEEPDANLDGLGLDGEPEMGDENSTTKDIDKWIGKAADKIRKSELTPDEINTEVNTFLSAYKDHFENVDDEDKEKMVNRILKPKEDEEGEEETGDMETVPVPEETEIEENEVCEGCGGFTQYAESRGYTRESIMECGDEEMNNLVAGYANAHGEGENDGDFENVALYSKDNTLDTLREEYGLNEYANALESHVNSMNESSDEDKTIKIDELWGGLQSLGQGAANLAKKGASAVGGAIQKGAQAAGNFVQKGVDAATSTAQKGASAVSGAVQKGAQAVGQAGQAVKQQYYKGEINPVINNVEAQAATLGQQIAKLNATLTKAGQQPVNVKGILATIQNQVGAGKAANIGSKVQPVKEDAIEERSTMYDMIKNAGKLAPQDKLEYNDLQSKLTKDGELSTQDQAKLETLLSKTGVSEEMNEQKITELSPETIKSAKSKAVQKTYNAKYSGQDPKLVDKYAKQAQVFRNADYEDDEMNEQKPSAGLTAKKKSEVVKKAKSGEDLGKKGKGFEKIATKAAKQYGNKEAGEKVAAAAMWKNVKREGVKEKETLSESERKLRNYVRQRLEELKGIRKPVLNENKKSETLKKLDRLIEQQYKLQETIAAKGWAKDDTIKIEKETETKKPVIKKTTKVAPKVVGKTSTKVPTNTIPKANKTGVVKKNVK